MKPDLRGVNQWGSGKYSELRKQNEIRDRKRPGEAARQALAEKKSRHRYLVSLPPELAEYAKTFGQGRLSSGLKQVIHMVKMSGASPISEFVQGDVYEALNVRLSTLENELRTLRELVTKKPSPRGRKRRIDFPPTTDR